MLLLSDQDVRRLLTQELARQIVREAAVAYSTGRALVPRRTQMELHEHHGEMLVMPGYLPDIEILGIKQVAEFPTNLALGLSTAPAVLLLFDPSTGYPAALIDATYLTLARTAAMSVVAAEHLAVPEPRMLAVIGAGGQSGAHINAFLDRFGLDEVRVFSRTANRADALVLSSAQQHPGARITRASSAEAAAEGAHLVLLATTSPTPVLDPGAVGPGQLVMGIGSHSLETAELHGGIVATADRVVVDTRVGSMENALDIAQAIEAGTMDRDAVAELGEVVGGSKPGRTADDQLTVFKSVGFAALDLTAARKVLDLAAAQSVGTEIAF